MSVGLEDQKQRIRTMFDDVAPRYDFLNHFLSAGIDVLWRKKAVREMNLLPGARMLDLCTGTGDLGFEAIRAVPGISVVGVDLARNMLRIGEGKRDGVPFLFAQGDAEQLPIADASIHGAGVGFGIRNVSSLETAFREVSRVMLPGGRFVILEFTTPPNPVFRRIYQAYFHHVLPRVGGWISGNAEAYRYLPDSVSRFPSPERLAAMLEDAGFARVSWSLLSVGIAALHVAER